MDTVILKEGRDKSVLRHHPWIFSGAVREVTGNPGVGETVEVRNAREGPINDRIRFVLRMMGAERFSVSPRCQHTIDALRGARWDGKHPTEDVRLDDGTLNVDSLDAMEYAIERVMGEFIQGGR